MPSHILSVKLNHTTIITGPYPEILTGQRPILAVTGIVAKVQSTVLFGNDLYSIGLASNLDQMTIFRNFVISFKNQTPRTWAQLSQIPPPPIPYPYNVAFANSAPPPVPPVSHGKLDVMDAGYDPLRGYWIEFLGNYFLTFPIFKDWAKDVQRDGPNFTGFQPSSNNNTPGGNGSGSGSGGGNCG